jgi:hypothetical protein
LARLALKPRALMAQSCALICANCRLSASRSASGMLVAPERRMSCAVMTWIEAAACRSRCGSLATDVTSTFINSSTLRRLSSPAAGACAVVSACACPACPSRRHVNRLATPGAPCTTAAVSLTLAGRVFRVRSLDMDCLRHSPCVRIPYVGARCADRARPVVARAPPARVASYVRSEISAADYVTWDRGRRGSKCDQRLRWLKARRPAAWTWLRGTSGLQACSPRPLPGSSTRLSYIRIGRRATGNSRFPPARGASYLCRSSGTLFRQRPRASMTGDAWGPAGG